MHSSVVWRRWLVALVAGLLVVAAWSPESTAQGISRYVDNIKTCNNLVPCHSTIQAAVAAASPGDKLMVFAGVYKETVTIDATQTGLKVQAQSASQPPVIAAPSGAGPAVTIAASGVQLVNLVLQADDTVVLDAAPSGTVIQNNIIRSRNRAAVAVLLGATGATMRGNDVIAGGILVGTSSGVTIATNEVTDAGSDGIAFRGTQSSTIQGNIVRGVGGVGIALREGVIGNTVQDNIVTSSTGDGILASGGGVLFGANIFRRNTAVENGVCDINDTYTAPSTMAADTWQSNRFGTKCGAAAK